MDKDEFEQLCTDSRLRPVFRHDTKTATVFIADGWFAEHPDRPYPHYRTVWAIGRGEGDLRFGRSIYTEGGVGVNALQDRISTACADALQALVGADEARRTIAEHRNPERLYNG